jgi:hypothetical protein
LGKKQGAERGGFLAERLRKMRYGIENLRLSGTACISLWQFFVCFVFFVVSFSANSQIQWQKAMNGIGEY